MRHGKIVGRVAVMLVGLTNGMPVQAVAPPVPNPGWRTGNGEISGTIVTYEAKSFDQGPSQSWLENWQRLDHQRQQDRKALAASFRTDSAAPDFSRPTKREFTIVVRIEEGSRESASNDLFWRVFDQSVAIPPAHAVHRSRYGFSSYFGKRWHFRLIEEPRPQEEFEAVVETLQRKLMELHEDGVFEVVVDPRRDDRADVNIRYEPVFSTPPDPPENGMGFIF